MKRFNICIAMLAAMPLAAMLAMPQPTSADARFPPIATPLPGLRPSPNVLRWACPDLAAQDLTATIVQKTSQFTGRIEMAGTIRNIGLVEYRSTRRQQSVQLVELPQGGAPIIVAQQSFETLASGANLQLRYRRNWDAALEFPPAYRLQVSFDPDIRQDENPANDDCKSGNDMRELHGEDISRLFP